MVNTTLTRNIIVAAVGVLLSLSASLVYAEENYPTKSIQLVIPYAPGGSSDSTARALAESASKILKQPIVIVNKPGAAGAIGTAYIASAKSDGYTLGLVTPGQLSITPHMQEVSYDPITDLTPITQYAAFSLALVVRDDSPYETLEDYIQAARSKPGAIDYGTTGVGSIGQLLMEQLADHENIELVSVPYTGGAPALTALLGGHIKSYAAAEYYSHVQAGDIRVLAFLGDSKPAEMEDVPTLKELDYPFKFGVYFGIVGPKDLPLPIRTKLEKAFIEATKDKNFVNTMNSFQLQIKTRSGKDFGQLIKDGYNVNKELIEKLGLGDH